MDLGYHYCHRVTEDPEPSAKGTSPHYVSLSDRKASSPWVKNFTAARQFVNLLFYCRLKPGRGFGSFFQSLRNSGISKQDLHKLTQGPYVDARIDTRDGSVCFSKNGVALPIELHDYLEQASVLQLAAKLAITKCDHPGVPSRTRQDILEAMALGLHIQNASNQDLAVNIGVEAIMKVLNCTDTDERYHLIQNLHPVERLTLIQFCSVTGL